MFVTSLMTSCERKKPVRFVVVLCIRDSDIYMYMYSGVFEGREEEGREKEGGDNKVMLNETVKRFYIRHKRKLNSTLIKTLGTR